MHGGFVVVPDVDYCNYLIMLGTNFGFGAGYCGPEYYAKKFADARSRGMKTVVIDPVCSNAASKADEWVPILPGTDGMLALSIINVLLNELCIYDVEFLTKRSNAPYLVGPDGRFVRDPELKKPLVWDLATNTAKPYLDPEIREPALEGVFEVNNIKTTPSFQLFKEHVKKYTVEGASRITTIPAKTIRRLAKEFAEEAKIGSTVVIEGKKLPYRPACFFYWSGAQSHKHAFHTALACELVNAMVGAIDVPGGLLAANPITHYYKPSVSEPDGYLIPGRKLLPTPLPLRRPMPPETLTLLELFPVGADTSHLFVEAMLNPDKYKIPYKPEMMIHYYSNPLLSTGNPEMVAEAIKRVPFMVSFAFYIDETAEFADIVLPETCYLERYELFPNLPLGYLPGGMGYIVYQLRQPVVPPPPGVRPITEVLLELAKRLGFLGDFYKFFNRAHRLKEPYILDPTKEYTLEEILDRWAKSTLGPEYGLEYLKKHGFVAIPKKVEEVYEIAGGKYAPTARVPIYFEFLKDAGEALKQVIKEMNITWDFSDYTPLVEWLPCPSHESKAKDYDLWATNSKSVYHYFSSTQENPWLDEAASRNPYVYNVLINAETARKKGIVSGDYLWVESEDGFRMRVKVKVTEGIHPQVVLFTGSMGHWAKGEPIAKGKGANINFLRPVGLKYTDWLSGNIDYCIKVRVYKE
jgi:molybdopterin-containing oxidoreductase family molybdopterin binding subunit